MTHEEVGFGFTPDVILFIGGGLLTIAVIVVFTVFLTRTLRAEKAADKQRPRGGA